MKCTSTLTGMPRKHDCSISKIEVVSKIVDLQEEINRDVEKLVDLKREIVWRIKAVDEPEYQTLLELRYLCFKTWEQIAVDMGYNVRHVFRLHDEAVNSITVPKTCH